MCFRLTLKVKLYEGAIDSNSITLIHFKPQLLYLSFYIKMENLSIKYIRESTRNLLYLNQRKQKHEEADVRRAIEVKKISAEVISDIANKLKTKSSIDATDLQTLKNGLMEPKNVEIFFDVHGALRGLVREITGSNVKKQCLAAGCCCNLALGNGRACSIIAKASGSYLSAALDNLTVELAVTCAWSLGNLAGSDIKVCEILVSQGALNKLTDIYTNEDIQDAALYALVQFVYQLRDELRPESLQKILKTITKLNITMLSSQIMFLLSCHNYFIEHVTEELLEKILVHLPGLIQSHQSCKQTDVCCELVFLIRTLANSNKFDEILNYLFLNCYTFKSLLDANNTTSQSVLWLLGNMFNYCSDREMFGKLIT